MQQVENGFLNKDVSSHYGGSDRLADRIAEGLRETGLDPDGCRARDLEAVDDKYRSIK